MSTYENNRQRSEAANQALWSFMDAYAEAIGEHPTKNDPETRAARKIAAEAFGYLIPYPVTDEDRETVAAMVEAIADRWTQDHETETDPKTGAQLWTPEAVRDLMSICERHERTTPREWHITVDIDETAQDFTDTSADGTEDAEEARELLRSAWNRRKPRRLHLAEDTARIIDVYSI